MVSFPCFIHCHYPSQQAHIPLPPCACQAAKAAFEVLQIPSCLRLLYLMVLLEHGGQGISCLLEFGLLQGNVEGSIRQLKFEPVQRPCLPDDIGERW